MFKRENVCVLMMRAAGGTKDPGAGVSAKAIMIRHVSLKRAEADL